MEFAAWATEGSDDAFLILDRNENHNVDNGGELFGNGTMLLSGESPVHGLQALAELDEYAWGGNGDGIISKEDGNLRKLRLWQDLNQNGVSERNEIKNLRHAGIAAIDLSYSIDPEVDENGNILGLFGAALQKVGCRERLIQVVDVFFNYYELVPDN